LLAAIMGSFVAGLDATAVNVTPPAIRADLGGADETDAGIASGVNNAIARIARLLAIAAHRRGHLRAVQPRA